MKPLKPPEKIFLGAQKCRSSFGKCFKNKFTEKIIFYGLLSNRAIELLEGKRFKKIILSYINCILPVLEQSFLVIWSSVVLLYIYREV